MASSVSNPERILEINNELRTTYQAEEEFWRQRSRQLWLMLGDRNTGYFHAATKGRKAINNFFVIENDVGEALHEEEQIISVIADYFQNIYTSERGERTSTVAEALQPRISAEVNASLIIYPAPEEIKHACFSIHADKAPGPNGFSASFF